MEAVDLSENCSVGGGAAAVDPRNVGKSRWQLEVETLASNFDAEPEAGPFGIRTWATFGSQLVCTTSPDRDPACQADQENPPQTSVPWRRRLAQIAHATVSKANHYGVAVTGLNETQLQQSRSQMASCLAKRMYGKSATTELDPVFDSLASVIALAHALWDGWMPQATKAKCVRTAQLEQRNNARLWTAVKGPFGAAVATLKRMHWTILEHDPFLWCMHDGRIVDPRRVCPHSMHTLLKKAVRALQWRHVALHEGYEGFDRGAVVAPPFAALYSPRLSAPKQAYLRSVVVDGQWTQQRKYRAAKTLSPPCVLCSSEEGSSGTSPAPKCQTASQATCWALSTRRPNPALFGSTSLLQRARCCQPSKGDRQGTRSPAKLDGQAIAVCSQESSAATARPAKGMRWW